MSTPYESTDKDIHFARLLGILYVLISIFLAYMLFVVWPPIPWPASSNQRIDPEVKAQLEAEARNCGCLPSSSSSNGSSGPQATSQAAPQTQGGATNGGSQNSNQASAGTVNSVANHSGAQTGSQPGAAEGRQPSASEPSNNGAKRPEKPNEDVRTKLFQWFFQRNFHSRSCDGVYARRSMND